MHRKGKIIKMKKRILLTVGLLLSACVILTACGKKKTPNNNTSTESSVAEDGNVGEESMTPAENENRESGLTYLRDAVAEALGEEYWPNTVMEPEYLQDLYGIKPEMYDDVFAETPMIGTHVDTLLIVKAKEGQVEAVENALNAHRESEIANSMQYPMNVGKVQASRIETIDNYVCFVQLGGSAINAAEEGDERVMEISQEENEKALEAIRNALAEPERNR